MSLRSVTLSVLILLSVTPAHAGMLEIDFDISSSVFVPFSSNVAAMNGVNATFTGSARVVLTGVDALGVATGMSAGGTLSGFRLDIQLALPLVVGPGVPVLVTGPVSFQQIGSASGAFGGQAFGVPAGQLVQRFTTDVGCTGPGCSALQAALFRAPRLVVDDMLANAAPLAFGLGGLGAAGMATLQASIQDTATSAVGVNVAIRIDVNGREIARRFVDEPPLQGVAALAALGLLCALATLRRSVAAAQAGAWRSSGRRSS